MTEDTITLKQLQKTFKTILERLDGLESELTAIREGLTAAAAAPTPTQDGQTVQFLATEIIMTYNDEGKPAYKAKGGRYMKYGVRIWDEVLPLLGLDAEKLKPGPNPVNIQMRALMGEKGPRKIIGRIG